MSWTERQHALLRAMGVRLWSPPAHDGAPAPAPAGGAGAPSQPVPALDPSVERSVPLPAQRAVPVSAQRAAPVPALRAAPEHTATPASASPLSSLDWPALRTAVADCRACGLCESRTQTVFGSGHLQAHWLVVGEAPGEQEDLSGEPFVGAAGQLLDRMLAALHLTRAQDGGAPPGQRVYIANALKCRPPRNRNPSAAELAQCEPFLVRQIQLLQPRIILAMGRYAVQALLRSEEPIGRLRGRVHRYEGVPLVVTYHPAYLLRNLPEKAKAWADLCLAAEVADRTREPA